MVNGQDTYLSHEHQEQPAIPITPPLLLVWEHSSGDPLLRGAEYWGDSGEIFIIISKGAASWQEQVLL